MELDSSIENLTTSIRGDLRNGVGVALGFECPLFVPLRSNPSDLTLQRQGDGGRPWSAGAGCQVLTTGLVQVAWVLDQLREDMDAVPSLSWSGFMDCDSPVFLWEAFVSGGAKSNALENAHALDAEIAVRAFHDALPDVSAANAIHEPEVYSLIGAALLRTGHSEDLGLLNQSCVVIKA